MSQLSFSRREYELGALDELVSRAARRVDVSSSLDLCWDLHRQRRRALREAGRNPDAAGVRRPEVVERYEQ